MRRIVIAEMLILGLWALYLGIVLTQASGNEVKHASAWGQTRSQSEFPVFAKHKIQGDESEPPRWGMPLQRPERPRQRWQGDRFSLALLPRRLVWWPRPSEMR
jgi:hypothetical protein